ncbi:MULTISPECIES: M28 family peptidase [unclassified Janthinobacterium]|uniref:M28 family peptidase n=1 Tax=unclassified Janthinobacterium TaxID=2610881 RepID=UPI001606FFAC|nr:MULTISPECIES: M28 family peptidase [unclassified Janthinobacterium]MBB5370684.1 Zn-dependent M28 family amino/carboxypeptidase [Janthinobacterium sp. K2C7]MBB5383490.1 Zn-dependent M28 family amino/carboxypeptidase [Janthinobacterium sp. K2Li3]MBB5388944.1 Zn-dependent M28 family amino/carboxypeptidase [Janthinobacterium sp. K2E3]
MRSSLALAAGIALLSSYAHAQSLPVVAEAPLRAHLSFLADDLLEGRGTGQRGGDLAVRYLETQAALIGLQPLKDGTYRQGLKIVGSKALPDSTVSFTAGGKTFSPVVGKGIVYGASNGQEKVVFDASVVFVGYGIRAPEEQWDDFKGIDVKGKLLVMMVNDPQPTAAEPNRFAGKSLTYYGRWVYKYEEALRQGAAGVLLIHTTESASYPWSVPANGFSHERFNLAGAGNAFEGWLQEDTARELFQAAGQDLDALRTKAETREFQPVALNATVQVKLDSKIRSIEQFNVAGIVPGTDPKLKDEAVIYSAHWDHLGIDEGGQARGDKTDHIYNGAVDNASGAAALLAMAQVAVKQPARRTQIFLWPAGEETGMLGSTAWVRSPLWPLDKTAADLNLDSMNFVGKTRDIGVAGAERSSLYASAGKVAKRMGLRLAPAIPDLSGAYFRADHFSFAKAGVPAFNVGSAVFSGDGYFDFVKDPKASSERMVAFKKVYHQVTDEYNPAWDLSGMVQQAQFTLNLGYEVANDKTMPTWNKGEAFGKVKR